MKRIIALLLLAAWPVFAADIITDVDSQNTSADDITVFEKDNGRIRINFYTDGSAVAPTGTVTFWYATNGLISSAYSSFTGSVSGDTFALLSYSTNEFPVPTPGTHPWVYGVSIGNKTYGDGKLYIKNDPFKGGGLLDLITKIIVDYTTATQFIGTAASGPVRPDGISITNVVNADGSITIYANIASYTESDPVWVAASGSVVYAESDPIYAASSNAWVRKAGDTMSGNLDMGNNNLDNVDDLDVATMSNDSTPVTITAGADISAGDLSFSGSGNIDMSVGGGDILFGANGDITPVHSITFGGNGVGIYMAGDNIDMAGGEILNQAAESLWMTDTDGFTNKISMTQGDVWFVTNAQSTFGTSNRVYHSGNLNTNSYLTAETDPIWVAASGSVVYVELDPVWVAASSGVRYAAIDLTTNDLDATADGAYRNVAETDPVWLAASGSVVRVGSDLYYEGGSLKFFESDVALSVLNNSVGHMFIDLQNGSEKIMYEASATNMDIALGMIYGKNSGKKFLDIAAHNIYGAGGQLNIELDVAYEIRDTAGHDTLRFTDASQALMYDGGTVKAFDLASSKQINNHVGTKILQLDSDVGLFGENANLILGMSAIHGYRVNDKGGTNFIDLALRRLTNVVNIGFADGTVQTTASAGGGGGGAGASYSEDFAPGDFDAVTNLTITHNLGEKVIAQIFDASSNQFFTGLQLYDDNAVFDMHLLHSTTGFVVVAAGTNTVNFSEFLTSGNVGSNDLDTATDTAYRSGGGSSYEPEVYQFHAYHTGDQNNFSGTIIIDISSLASSDPWGLVDASTDLVWLNYGNVYDGSTNVWEFKWIVRLKSPVNSCRYRAIGSSTGSVRPQTYTESTSYGVGGQYVTWYMSALVYATNSAYFVWSFEEVCSANTADLIHFTGEGRWLGKLVTTNAYTFLY